MKNGGATVGSTTIYVRCGCECLFWETQSASNKRDIILTHTQYPYAGAQATFDSPGVETEIRGMTAIEIIHPTLSSQSDRDACRDTDNTGAYIKNYASNNPTGPKDGCVKLTLSSPLHYTHYAQRV